MLFTLKNEKITLSVDSLGAQMMSLLSSDGTEYLWQGEAEYWSDRAPNLFPFIRRLTNNSYKYNGIVYPMGIHGFAAAMEFEAVHQSENSVTLELSSSLITLAQYPFDFCFRIRYCLRENPRWM